jgi:hypothetical protein
VSVRLRRDWRSLKILFFFLHFFSGMDESDGVCSTQTAAGSDTAEGTQNNTVLVQIEEEERTIRVMPFVTTLSFVRTVIYIFHTKGPHDALKFAWNDEAETARNEAALMTEKSRCVAAAAGTAASGASIEGQDAVAVITDLRDARAPGDEQPRRKRCDVSEECERRHAQGQDEKFWACQQGTDNATYFKSKENLNFWFE